MLLLGAYYTAHVEHLYYKSSVPVDASIPLCEQETFLSVAVVPGVILIFLKPSRIKAVK